MRLLLIATAMAMLSALASAQGNCTSFLILANTFPASIASGDATESLSVSIVSGECIITGDITWTRQVASQIQQCFQTIGPGAFENRDRFDLAFARAQCLEHGVWTIDRARRNCLIRALSFSSIRRH